LSRRLAICGTKALSSLRLQNLLCPAARDRGVHYISIC
jgi:hypothetical protein